MGKSIRYLLGVAPLVVGMVACGSDGGDADTADGAVTEIDVAMHCLRGMRNTTC